jgi:hypothetical protein
MTLINGYCSYECYYSDILYKRNISRVFSSYGINIKDINPHVTVEKKHYLFIGEDRRRSSFNALAYWIKKGMSAIMLPIHEICSVSDDYGIYYVEILALPTSVEDNMLISLLRKKRVIVYMNRGIRSRALDYVSK